MSEPSLDPSEQHVERTLARLAPVSPGRASAASVLLEVERRRQRLQLFTWRAVAAVLGLALVIQISLHRRPPRPAPPLHLDPVATLTVPIHRSTIELPLTGDDYISTRNRMIAFDTQPACAPVPEAQPPRIRASRNDEPSPSFIELLFTNPEPVHS